MTSSTITVVGGRFAGFADTPGVETVESFLDLLSRHTDLPTPVLVRAGQGVEEAEWDRLVGHAQRHGYADRIVFEPYAHTVVGRHEAHKHSGQNTLLADLTRCGPDEFAAALRVHNDNELLLDHQTGRHVQGMVCVEAARQMFLAVTERYIVSAFPGVSYYYVINEMDTAFENFLFPLPAEVRMTVLAADASDPDRVACQADIGIHQSGRRASRSVIGYVAFRHELLAPIEAKKAVKAVECPEFATPALAGAGVAA